MKNDRLAKAESNVALVRETCLAELREIDADARFHYPCATIQINAPLALEQLQMETRVRFAQRILALMGYKGRELRIKPGPRS
ncbi:MAG TPA: hypothetical protein VIV56_16820 [Gemmatimonadales bacterium]